MAILGISAFYHDSAAALIHNGRILCAAQEERFTRIKFDSRFPQKSIEFCLKSQNIKPQDLEFIVFYEKPFQKFDRILESFLATAPKGLPLFLKAIPEWLHNKLFQKEVIVQQLQAISKDFGKTASLRKKILFSEHHISHAASAFFPSPFESSAILTIDGVGEWSTATVAIGQQNQIEMHSEMRFPHSLGLLYSAFTAYLGFKVNSGEYKMMGLAPYGKPKFKRMILQNMLALQDDGSFILNMDFFNFLSEEKMFSLDQWHYLFGTLPRKPESEITQTHMDIAASIQSITEEILVKMGRHIQTITHSETLCMAGGVALNCVANSALLKENIFKSIWVQPAAGDAGGAIGAALAVEYLHKCSPRKAPSDDLMKGALLGPVFSTSETQQSLDALHAQYQCFPEDVLLQKTALALSQGAAVGWMNGPMEFGPRALGNRSILADPRSSQIQTDLNLKIKFRESFRPFAPAVLQEKSSDWFDFSHSSPYMLFTAPVHKKKCLPFSNLDESLTGIELLKQTRSQIPAVTHVDFSARLQTVDREMNPRFYRLIKEFEKLTGCPLLVNTSFNVRGEPIVCTPEDAYRCFMNTDLDILVIGEFFLEKKHQPDWRDQIKTHLSLD